MRESPLLKGTVSIKNLHFGICISAPEFPIRLTAIGVPVLAGVVSIKGNCLYQEPSFRYLHFSSGSFPHGRCHFGRHPNPHVDVAWAHLCFDDLEPFPIAQRPYNFSSFLPKEYFPPVFRCECYTVLNHTFHHKGRSYETWFSLFYKSMGLIRLDYYRQHHTIFAFQLICDKLFAPFTFE